MAFCRGVAIFGEGGQGALVIVPHEAAIAHHVGTEDGSQLALDVGRGHGSLTA